LKPIIAASVVTICSPDVIAASDTK
jgi:hypothetical protein